MNYYQEITLLPDVDISLGFLWQKVFQQVHIALVDNKVAANQSAVAISFPDYRKTNFPLGSKLRLFADDKATLETLGIEKWLNRLDDYVHIKGIRSVPNEVSYVSFARKQVKSPERIESEMQKKLHFGLLNQVSHLKNACLNWTRPNRLRFVLCRLFICIASRRSNARQIRTASFLCLLK